MTPDNYLTPDELRGIADYCESLRPLWDSLTSGAKEGITVEADEVELVVYDSNGDKVGRITWCDSGPAFYPWAVDN